MNIKNKKVAGVACAVLSGIIIGSTATGVFAASQGNEQAEQKKTEATTVSDTVSTLDRVLSKDETVYVIAAADGTPKKIIVSDWLKNATGDTKITDKSELRDINNLKGDESYSMNSNNMCEWDANGKDIYYQGNTQKALPVDVNISYKLDGKSVTAEELAGKSGKVEIKFTYKNNQKEAVSIDGKKEDIYVPFVMLSGLMLENEHFTNVAVTNGKILNDGDKTIVMGFALPGMQDNLAISRDTFNIPESVTITADAKDFALTTSMTLATNEPFNEIDTAKLDSASTLTDSLTKLDEAAKQLVSGSSKLYGGLSQLMEKSQALVAGIKKLNAGAAELDTNLANLATGLQTLTSNNKTLNDGAKEVFNTLLATADTQLKQAGLTLPALTISNYNAVLDGAVQSLDEASVRKLANAEALKTVTETVNKSDAQIRAGVNAQKDTIKGLIVKAQLNMTLDEYNAAIAQTPSPIPATVQAAIDQAVSQQIEQLVAQKKQELIQENMATAAVTAQIEAAVTKAKQGVASMKALKAQLNKYNEFYQGVLSYTQGASTAANGSAKLSAGATTLANGLSTLDSSASALPAGVSELKQGGMTLSNGMQEFYDSGIKKLTEKLDGNLSSVVTRIKATVAVSKDYKNYSGLADGMDGSVKFIYRTESIEAKKDENK